MEIADATSSYRENSVFFTFTDWDFLFLWTLFSLDFWRENWLEELIFASVELNIEEFVH